MFCCSIFGANPIRPCSISSPVSSPISSPVTMFVVSLLVALVFCLSPSLAIADSQTTISSIRNGAWSDISTWNLNRIPQAGDNVQVNTGHEVLYDLNSSTQIRSILINGKLEFNRNVNTFLDVGLIALTTHANFDVNDNPCGHGGMMMGGGTRPVLEVGTYFNPIPANVTATIRLRHHAGMASGCSPVIISHGGRIDLHGYDFGKTWVKLGATSPVGSNQLTLAEPVTWKVGDKVVIPATDRDPDGYSSNATIENGEIVRHTEDGFIQAISSDNRTITIDHPLVYERLGSNDPNDLRGEIGNLSRNVIIESADPNGVRGHTMFHKGSAGDISYAEFRHLGKDGILGRYPIHYHLVEDTMRGSFVIGASIWDSDNRWLVIHGTEYLVVRDTVGYWGKGHGYFLENGAEVYNLIDNTLGVNALIADPIPNQALAYDPNDGGCYWAANARNFVYNSTFVECDSNDSFILDYDPDGDMMVQTLMPDGSRQTVAVNRLSGGGIKNLEVHAQNGWGPWIRNGVFPADEPVVFENTKVWNSNYSLDISGDNVVFDGVELYDAPYGFYNLFPGPHVIRNAYCEDVGPHGCFMNYRGGSGPRFYENITTTDSRLVIRMTVKNETGSNGQPVDIHARNVNVLNPGSNTHYIGTEGDNVRSDPRLMLVMHDMFGPDQDAVILPDKQPSVQPGVPAGLVFQDGGSITANGVGFEGRGEMKVATGNVAWPSTHPILNPVDRVPPASVILFPKNEQSVGSTNGALVVSGVSLDQNSVSSVKVNGLEANINANGYDWSITLNGITLGPLNIIVQSTDTAGNIEQHVHSIDVSVDCIGPNCNTGGPVIPSPPLNLRPK